MASACVYSRWGGPECLHWVPLPEGPVAPDSVRIQVHWAGVNPADAKLMSGRYRLFCKGRFPRRIGSEGSGRIVAFGQNVRGLGLGSTVVFGIDPPDGRTGAWSEVADVAAHRVVALPAGVSARDAAVLPIAGLAAWLMCRAARLKAGDAVLVTGASGGVGSFAVQWARQLGAVVTATGSERNRELIRTLGAHEFIDYRGDALATGGRRWRAILDCVSCLSRQLSRRLLLTGGRCVDTDPKPLALLVDLWRGIGSGRRWNTVRVNMQREGMLQLLAALRDGHLRPLIAGEWPLERAPDAMRESMTGHVAGKLLLRTNAASFEPSTPH